MYNQEDCQPSTALTGTISRPTVSERLKTKKKQLEAELSEVNSAIEVFEKHPEIAKVLNVVARVGY